MSRLTLKEMKYALGEVAVATSWEMDDVENAEDIVEYLDSDELSTEIEYIRGSSENYTIEVVENGGCEGDGAEMYLTFKVQNLKNNEIGYIKFSGRYSSWDSSYYDEYYETEPKDIVVTAYGRLK